MYRILIALGIILIPFKTNAACSNDNNRAFDFWLGEWQVTTAIDSLIRYNNISKINDGCTLLEQYSTPNGFKGTSLTMYDKQNDEWHQTWTDNAGYLLKLKGKFIGQSMVMFGFSQNKNQRILNKISWTPNKDGTVRQHWQISSDNGKTWSTTFDGIYTKKSN
jgi:hypothetical protein